MHGYLFQGVGNERSKELDAKGELFSLLTVSVFIQSQRVSDEVNTSLRDIEATKAAAHINNLRRELQQT